MSNIERHLAEFPVGCNVAIWNTLQRFSGYEYMKAVVVRHTKNRIMVRYLNGFENAIGDEHIYDAETLAPIDKSYRRHFNKIIPWDDNLELAGEIAAHQRKLNEIRKALGNNVDQYNYDRIVGLSRQIILLVELISTKNERLMNAR